MIRHLTTLTAVATLLCAAPLSAQHEHHQQQQRDTAGARGMMGQMRGQGMMGQRQEMMPGMALRAYAPTQLLAKRTELKLTDDQATKLEKLQAEATQAHDQAAASHDRYREQMMEALRGDSPDPTTIQGLFRGAHTSMGEAHWAEMGAALAAMALLTPEQRAMVKSWPPASGMQHRHGQQGQQGR